MATFSSPLTSFSRSGGRLGKDLSCIIKYLLLNRPPFYILGKMALEPWLGSNNAVEGETLPPWLNNITQTFIVTKGDENYNASITPAYALPTWLYYQPQSVVYPTKNEELVEIVQKMAKKSISPIGGAHSSFGYAFSGVDAAVSLRKMAKVGPIDEENLELTVEAGALLEDVINFLNGTGYMTATGSCPTVGVSGWHLGGGFSMFSKKLGLGADIAEPR